MSLDETFDLTAVVRTGYIYIYIYKNSTPRLTHNGRSCRPLPLAKDAVGVVRHRGGPVG